MSTKAILAHGASNKPIQFAGAIILLAGAGYLVYKNAKPSEGEKAVENAETNVSKDNPFSFAQFLGQTIPSGTPLLKVAVAQSNAKQVYDALSGYFFDSPDMIIGLFNSYKNKAQVAMLAQAFYNGYKRDILDFLKKGNKTFDFGTGGLSTTDYERILTIVSKKPKF